MQEFSPKTIVPKIETRSNGLSQIEATCLLTIANVSGEAGGAAGVGYITPPAMKCLLQQQQRGEVHP